MHCLRGQWADIALIVTLSLTLTIIFNIILGKLNQLLSRHIFYYWPLIDNYWTPNNSEMAKNCTIPICAPRLRK